MAPGANYLMGKNEHVLVPARREGKAGFYLFAGKEAHWYETPKDEFLKIQLAGDEPIYMNYSGFNERKRDADSPYSLLNPMNPGIGVTSKPVQNVTYRELGPNQTLDSDAIKALLCEIEGRLAAWEKQNFEGRNARELRRLPEGANREEKKAVEERNEELRKADKVRADAVDRTCKQVDSENVRALLGKLTHAYSPKVLLDEKQNSDPQEPNEASKH